MSAGKWSCPLCGCGVSRVVYRVPPPKGEAWSATFLPSTQQYGSAVSDVVRCRDCGHMSVERPPESGALMEAYEAAADEVSLREEAGQIATGDRDLARVERHLRPGRLLDLGCWTGSMMVAAERRGWTAVGVEPSVWGRQRALERGLDVRDGDLFDPPLAGEAFRLVVLHDVLEHVVDPVGALRQIGGLLQPGGCLHLTVPNAGSLVARALGRRWWSVLPMHLQYFTPDSLRFALEQAGFAAVAQSSHAKMFSARYYAERLRGYSQPLGRGVVTILERAGVADRQVGPNFGDRLAMLARFDPLITGPQGPADSS